MRLNNDTSRDQIATVGPAVAARSTINLLQLETFDSNYRSLESPAFSSFGESGTHGRMTAVAGSGGRGPSRRRAAAARHRVSPDRRTSKIKPEVRELCDPVYRGFGQSVQSKSIWRELSWTVQCRAAAAGHQVGGQALVTGAVGTVAEAVDGEIEAGVQVRQHGGVEVDGQRESVSRVVEQHDDVRDPAAGERDEDDEHRLHLANCLHRRDVASLASALCTEPKQAVVQVRRHTRST